MTADELYEQTVRDNPNASEKQLRDAFCEAMRAHPEAWREAFDFWWQCTHPIRGPFEEETFRSA